MVVMLDNAHEGECCFDRLLISVCSSLTVCRLTNVHVYV